MCRKIEILWLGLILIFALIVGGCGTDSDKTDNNSEVIVFAALGTLDATTEIADMFSKETGIKVTTNFASSSFLAQQIELGAEADVYISANQKWADFLQDKQLIDRREAIAKNSIVIIVPENPTLSCDSQKILLSDDVKSIAMCETSSVPAGMYGKEALENIGLWEKVKDKVVETMDVRAALAYVETRAAEAGIVYYTDTFISDKVKIAFIFPDDALSKPIIFSAMTLTNAANQKNADLFFDFLKDSKSIGVFKKYGFKVDLKSE